MIKAIETKYKGYRFRSRLEARWAVFFDALGVQWEYEKEGYDLGEAGYYLPDFWLPSIGCFWEIKPREGYGADEYQKIVQFAKSNKLVVALGMPSTSFDKDRYVTHVFPIYIPAINDYDLWTSWTEECGWLSHCPRCDKVDFTFCGWAGYIAGCKCWDWDKKEYKYDGTSTPKMLSAIAAARSARFEYGEILWL